jgi:MFS family permease
MKTLNQLEPYQRQSLLVLFITGLLFWTSIAILLPTLPAYLDAIGINQQQLGLIIGAFAVGLLVTRPSLGKLADARGRKVVLLIGTAVATIAPLGYLTVTSIPWHFMGSVLLLLRPLIVPWLLIWLHPSNGAKSSA